MELISKDGKRSRRIGSFRLTTKFIEENPEIVADILSKIKFVPYEVKWFDYVYSLVFVGLSHLFRFVGAEEATPEYILEFRDNNIDTLKVVEIK